MHQRELRRFREAVRSAAYVVTQHGLDELEEDHLSIFDMESCVLTGSIVERQRDRRTGERKYVIHGEALDGSSVAVVTKFLVTGRMAVLTVYRI